MSAQQTFGLCQLFPTLQTWLVKIWPSLSLQQQPLRLNFVPTMRRNRIFGSASSRPSLQRQGSNRKNLNMPIPLHFRHYWRLQRLRWAVRLFEKYFAWTVWNEQMAILLWTASPSHENAGPKAQCSHGKAQTTSPSWSITWQWPFLSMFLIRLPPSMRETVEAGSHGTAAAMVKAADALWDARGGHNPPVTAASTQRSRSPAPSSRKRANKRGGNTRPKSRPPSRPDFYSFQNPGNGMCKFHNYYANMANRCIPPCSWSEN